MSGIKTNKKLDNQRGFTIVELLIVIVVIAILATITVVGFNGIQKRARDADREAAVATITKALEMYHIDNGGYPNCSGGTYRPGEPRSSCTTANANVKAALSPKYIGEVPEEPIGSGKYTFFYVFGSKKVSDTTYNGDSSDNYIIGVAFESRGGPYVTTWGPDTKHNYIAGSSN